MNVFPFDFSICVVSQWTMCHLAFQLFRTEITPLSSGWRTRYLFKLFAVWLEHIGKCMFVQACIFVLSLSSSFISISFDCAVHNTTVTSFYYYYMLKYYAVFDLDFWVDFTSYALYVWWWFSADLLCKRLLLSFSLARQIID